MGGTASLPAAAPPPFHNTYCEPRLLTGTIYAKDSSLRTVLFQFRRTASCEGDVVRVVREYTCPDATVAAREKVVYQANRMVSYELEDLRAAETGRVFNTTNAAGKAAVRLEFGPTGNPKKTVGQENAQPDTLINDMLPAFLEAHWNELSRGARVKFRFVAMSRAETVGFTVVKEFETTLGDAAVVRLRMEPTSFIIAQLVDPIFFLVEKEGAHRILQYTGRATPRVKVGNRWKDLDAVSVFDWK
jgi:hypothetical protein